MSNLIEIVLRLVINAFILLLIPSIVSGFRIDNFYSALAAVLVLGILNAFIKPLVVLLTLPINILTLGFFTLIINGLIFWLTSTIVKGFLVAGFWPAFWAALVFSIISIFIGQFSYKSECITVTKV